MFPDNDKIRDLLGVPAWHAAGYTGKRGLTLTGEDDNSKNSHGYFTRLSHLEIAPDREIVYPSDDRIGYLGGEYLCKKAEELGADVAFLSYVQSDYSWRNAVCPDSFFIAAASGNDSVSDYSEQIEDEQVYGVGALTLLNGTQLVPAYYSSESEYVDFAVPSSLWIEDRHQVGTSFSTPVLAGLAALVNDFFLDKTGRPLKRRRMYEFLKAHCQDVSVDGKDIKTGWGMPVLPQPETIDVWRWQDKMVSAKEVLDLARSQIGVKEDPAGSNNVKYNTDYYGRVIQDSAYAWCAVFIWWLFQQVGAPGLYYGGGKTASCTTLNAYHKARGQAVTDYQPGDIIFFDFSGKQSATEHVGICESIAGDYITTIDGNTGTASQANGGEVMRRKRHLKYVSAAYRPEYKEENDIMTREEFQALYDQVNPLYTSLTQVPEYWREEAAALMRAGAIQGDGVNPIYIRSEQLQAIIVAKRYTDRKGA